MKPRCFELEGTKVLDTEALKKTRRWVSDTVKEHLIGVFHGDAGNGKTRSLKLALAGVPNVYWCYFRLNATETYVANKLLDVLTGVGHNLDFDPADEALATQLRQRRPTIVIDEAQALAHDPLEYLRGHYDDPDTRFPLLFAGGNGCWETLRSYPMLKRRVRRRLEFSPLSESEVLQHIPTLHPIYAESEPEVILLVNDYFAFGNLGYWTNFTADAAGLCAEHNLQTLTEEVARNVFALEGGGGAS